MTKVIFQFLMLLVPVLGLSQVGNDECPFATHIGDVFTYCSETSEFSNAGASQSPEPQPDCWTENSHDVWFSFVPTAPAVFAQLFGADANAPNNIELPSLAIYSGPCNSLTLLGCGSISDGPNLAELTVSDLIIGQVYYLRIDARADDQGDFHFCMESFVPVPSPQSDCPDAVILCDKTGFQIENLNMVGDLMNEMTGPCTDQLGPGGSAERASVWYTWTCELSGTLEFTLSPNNPTSVDEDLDFIVYELPGGLNDCANRIALRCMLSGESQGNSFNQNSPCYGDTGLMAGDPDMTENPGCDPGDNNFLAPLDMITGVSYGILINNFSQSGFGFSIDFGGTGTFKGPEVDFSIVPQDDFECDKAVTFTNFSSSLTDEITEWNWTFGVGASMSQATGVGPHDITYDSFGNKIISLTVTTEKGCTVTLIQEQFIDPCCEDLPDLSLVGEVQPILCVGGLGSILLEGDLGSPAYQYAINSNSDFQPSPLFTNLDVGFYDLFVIDRKGCETEITLEIEEPDVLEIDIITLDTIIDLGFTVDIESVLTPPNANVTISWDPEEGLSCTDCLNPTAFAPGTTTYTITVEDANGCISRDQITITTEIVRPVYGPNIFTPNGDGNNNIFTLGFGPQTKSFNDLKIYDRWGNLVYEGANLPINDPTQGWNGRFKGELVNPAVFAWIAEVCFIDNVTLFVTGSVTVAR